MVNNKNLIVLTGFSCNNNCIICSVKDKMVNYPDRSFEDLCNELKKGIKNGFNWVEFTGGEPTIRSDIIKLVETAKELGYQKIAFSTNGRLFSYNEFCQKIIQAGLNKITFSLLGPDKKIHDSISRTPGSFTEIIKGIKNVQQFSDIHINISTVISKLNYKSIKSFGRFIISLGVKNWYLLDLIPDGNAKKFYPDLVVRLNNLSKELNGLVEISDNFNEFGFFDFPLCIFSPELRSKTNACFVNAKMRLETSQQVGYNPKRIELDSEGIYRDVYRENTGICRKCKYYKNCGGIWNNYLNLFGVKEVVKLAKKNNCL